MAPQNLVLQMSHDKNRPHLKIKTIKFAVVAWFPLVVRVSLIPPMAIRWGKRNVNQHTLFKNSIVHCLMNIVCLSHPKKLNSYKQVVYWKPLNFRSELSCSVQCARSTRSCSAFYFNPTTKICQLGSKVALAEASSDPGDGSVISVNINPVDPWQLIVGGYAGGWLSLTELFNWQTGQICSFGEFIRPLFNYHWHAGVKQRSLI